LLGLLSFPILFEPMMRLRVQGVVWSVLFGLFCFGCGWCAWRFFHAPAVSDDAPRLGNDLKEKSGSLLTVVLWFLLVACASAMLMSTTNQLCHEVISLPLLWVVPLALYLLSFILCFDHPRWYRREIFHPVFAIGVFVLCTAMRSARRKSW
jgi:hypothetical protein